MNYNDSLATFRVAGDSRLSYVSWSADASMQVYDYTLGRRTEDDRIRAFLYFTVNPQLRLSLSGGLESSNISTVNKETKWRHNRPELTTGYEPRWGQAGKP